MDEIDKELDERKCYHDEYISARNKVAQVASALAVENMHISEEFKKELLLIAQKKSSKEVLAELDKKYDNKHTSYHDSVVLTFNILL